MADSPGMLRKNPTNLRPIKIPEICGVRVDQNGVIDFFSQPHPGLFGWDHDDVDGQRISGTSWSEKML